MPGMDGYTVCQNLKANSKTRHIPIIFVTASTDKASETQGFKMGAVDYITKPINAEITLMRIRNQILLRKYENELESIARHDALTGLPNRMLLADRMQQAIARARRNNGMFGVCYLDLDGFKPVNDSMGHDAGDQVLIEIDKRISETLRHEDTVARLGGDEFVILLLELEKADEYIATLDRLLNAISRPIEINRQQFTVSASIGVSLFPNHAEDEDSLLKLADSAMYAAKQAGKNRYQLYKPEA
jgi:diguanylate cyclase (GGDEF)-like protein